MPKIVDREAKRQEIMRAAMFVFARTGYHAATIEEIARHAGLGKGTIYLYFKGKDDLAVSLIKSIFDEMEERYLSAGEQQIVTLDGFVEQLRCSMAISPEHARFIRVFFDIFGPSFSSNEVVTSVGGFFDRLAKHYATQIVRLQQLGEVAPQYDAGLAARSFVAMMDGLILHRGLFAISSQQHEKMIEQVITLFERGLRQA